MIVLFNERWLSSKRTVQFEHDGKVGTRGSLKGQSLSKIREQLIREEIQESIEVKPLVLRQYFLQQGNMEDAKVVEQVDLSVLRVQGERVMAEASLAGTSFLEGFLSVYGIELERAEQRYEEKLQLFETIDRERQQRAVFIGRLKQSRFAYDKTTRKN